MPWTHRRISLVVIGSLSWAIANGRPTHRCTSLMSSGVKREAGGCANSFFNRSPSSAQIHTSVLVPKYPHPNPLPGQGEGINASECFRLICLFRLKPSPEIDYH